MKKQRIALKILLFLLLASLVYYKLTHPNPDLMAELSSDLIIVLILLGIAEILLTFLFTRLTSFVLRFQKIKNNKI